MLVLAGSIVSAAFYLTWNYQRSKLDAGAMLVGLARSVSMARSMSLVQPTRRTSRMGVELQLHTARITSWRDTSQDDAGSR